MDLSTAILFTLVAVIGANQVLVRSRYARESPRVFWTLTIGDLFLGVMVLIFGLPGFERTPVVGWVVGLLFVMHTAQNLMLRNDWAQQERDAAKAERDEERKRRRQEREEREQQGLS
jgi:hypothetical protein